MEVATKIRTVLIGAALILTAEVNAQKVVTLNMGTHQLTGLDSLNGLKEGETYLVNVTGVNLNLYRVKVNGRDSSIATALTFPGFGNVATDVLAKLAGGLSLSSASHSSINQVYPAATNFHALTQTRKFQDLLGEYMMNVQKEDSLKKLMLAMLPKYNADIKILALDLTKLKVRIDNIALAVQKQSYKLRQMKPEVPDTTVDRFLVLLADVRQEVVAKQEGVQQLQLDFALWNTKAGVIELLKDKDTKSDAEALGKAMGELASTSTQLLTSIDATNTAKVLDPLFALQQMAGKPYTSAPFQYHGGDGKIDITVEPVEKDSRLPSYHADYSFPARPKMYWGVSAGFYGASLYSDAYSTLVDTADSYSIVQEHVDHHEIGVDALFTFGSRIGEKVPIGLHVVVGPGVGIAEKVRPRVLLGLGLSFGERNKVLLDGGFIAGWVDRRSAAFESEGPYKTHAGDAITVSKLDSSFFLSLGYFFWSGKR